MRCPSRPVFGSLAGYRCPFYLYFSASSVSLLSLRLNWDSALQIEPTPRLTSSSLSCLSRHPDRPVGHISCWAEILLHVLPAFMILPPTSGAYSVYAPCLSNSVDTMSYCIPFSEPQIFAPPVCAVFLRKRSFQVPDTCSLHGSLQCSSFRGRLVYVLSLHG